MDRSGSGERKPYSSANRGRDGGRPRRDDDKPRRDDRPRRDDDRPRRDGNKPNRSNERPKRDATYAKSPSQPDTPRRPKQRDPELPNDVEIGQLDREVRGRLRGLSKEHAERVGRHLVMVGMLLDINPELAYQHAQAAVRHASRIDVVREAAGLAAYRTGRYGEALSELRTARRLSGSSHHLAVMADAERGLGRPEKALDLAASEDAQTLTNQGKVELAIVESGARCDLGQFDAALTALDRLPAQKGDLKVRVLAARAAVLEAAGRDQEAADILATIDPDDLARVSGESDDDVLVFDSFEEDEEAEPTAEKASDRNRSDGDSLPAETRSSTPTIRSHESLGTPVCDAERSALSAQDDDGERAASQNAGDPGVAQAGPFETALVITPLNVSDNSSTVDNA